jgi:PAS domain S-box-containing protein
MGKTRGTLDLGNLRLRAEGRLRDRQQAAGISERDLERLVHELEVHQIELEMQNEELRESRVELESALARYTEIFDFAPIGYLTIGLDGTLHEINHSAARLLRRARAEMLGRRLDSMVVPRDRPLFSELLRRAVESETSESCELELFRVDGSVVRVKLLSSLLARAEPLVLLALEAVESYSEITDSGEAQSGVRGTKRSPVAI